MWGCLAAYQVGVYHYNITRTQIMKGDMGSQRDLLITGFLQWMIALAPLNLFLYSWRFLRELEQSVSNKVLKNICRGFEIFTIVVLPPAFYAVVLAWIYSNQEYIYYAAHLEPIKMNHWGGKNQWLSLAIDIFNPLMNVISCSILGLVVLLVFKLSRQVRVGKSAVATKR